MNNNNYFKEEIDNICKSISSHIIYNDANIYFVNGNILRKLLLLEDKVKTSYTGRIKNPFSKYAKIINPNLKATKYNFYMRKTPRIIKNEQKVFESLDKEFEIFKNVLLKELENGISKNKIITEAEASIMREEVKRRIELERKKLDSIKNNFNDYEVLITNYKNIRAYPAIHFTGEDGKHYNEHLSIRVPNFLYFEEDKNPSKSNANVKKFISNANLIGNTIYFKKK